MSLFGNKYTVKQIGRDHRTWYESKARAISYATIAAEANGGDWVVFKINRKGLSTRVWKSWAQA